MPAKSVFISSTSSDLVEHRAAVNEALRRGGYHAVDMEYFGARSGDPTTACLDEVEEADIFVGIYARRYGFVPDGSDVSITEMEFDYARHLDKQCYCFILDENHDWPAELTEDGVGAAKLDALKARIENELVRATFTTPDNLALQVVTSLTRHEKSEQKLLVEAAATMIPGASSYGEAVQMIGDALASREVTFEFDDEHDVFVVPYGSTFLEVEIDVDDNLGPLVVFRAELADEVDIEEMEAETGGELLTLAWQLPIGGIAFDQATETMWYRYSLPVAALTDEIIFSCVSHVAVTADNLDDHVREALPDFEPPARRWFG